MARRSSWTYSFGSIFQIMSLLTLKAKALLRRRKTRMRRYVEREVICRICLSRTHSANRYYKTFCIFILQLCYRLYENEITCFFFQIQEEEELGDAFVLTLTQSAFMQLESSEKTNLAGCFEESFLLSQKIDKPSPDNVEEVVIIILKFPYLLICFE